MSGKRYAESFKEEAVKQVTVQGYGVAEVASRLGVSGHSIYAWVKQFGHNTPEHAVPT